jgi:hypothetical protein
LGSPECPRPGHESAIGPHLIERRPHRDGQPPGWVSWLPNPRTALAYPPSSGRRRHSPSRLSDGSVATSAVCRSMESPYLVAPGIGRRQCDLGISGGSRPVVDRRRGVPTSPVASFNHGVLWLVLPLCAPRHPAALVVPALMASVAYTVGLVVTAWLHRPLPWLLAAWVAPLAHQMAMTWLVDNTFTC